MPLDTTQLSDESLARRAANGDRAAFEQIVLRHSRSLAEFAAARTHTVQDAEDIVQETFLRAFSHIKGFDRRFPLKPWLFTIAYRLIITGYRKKTPHLADDQTLETCDDRSPRHDTTMDWLWETAVQMGGDFHTVLWLYYKEQLTIAEIARVMKKNQLTVRVLLHRARRRLAKRLMDTASGQAEAAHYWIQHCNCVAEGSKS